MTGKSSKRLVREGDLVAEVDFSSWKLKAAGHRTCPWRTRIGSMTHETHCERATSSEPLNSPAVYIDALYNPSRRHGHLGGVSPEQFEAAQRARATGSPLNPGNSRGEVNGNPVATLGGCPRPRGQPSPGFAREDKVR
jgi:hypothetical protein